MKILCLLATVVLITTAAEAETKIISVSEQAPATSPRPVPRPANFDAEAMLQQTSKKLATQYGCSTITEDCIPPTT